MQVINLVVIVFLVFFVVRSHSESLASETISKSHGRRSESSHGHHTKPACADCPGLGRCVPRIQCPSLLRNAVPITCHLATRDDAGVCCYSHSHAAESDAKKHRSSSLVSENSSKSAQQSSRQKLDQLLAKNAVLLQQKNRTLLQNTSPSHGHHMSVMTSDRRVDELSRGALLNLLTAKELHTSRQVSDEQLLLGYTEHADGPYCPPLPSCLPISHRLIGGECTRPDHPTWGAVNTAFERILPPDYSDGVWGMKLSSNGLPLPSARRVSRALLVDAHRPSAIHNLLFMQFGQFIAHDVSSAISHTIGNGSAISCCENEGQDFLPPELQHWACAPVSVDEEDPFFSQFNIRCLNFVRSQLAPSPDCSVGYAKQMNGVTHYLDLSQLYGSTEEKLAKLRGPDGTLKTFDDFGRHLPPLTENEDCISSAKGAACFESGDNHGNQVISLTVLHTIWTREHNRLANALRQLNPMWTENEIFQEARRLTIAEYQHIVYNEWLPMLIGPKLVETFGLSSASDHAFDYDPSINPSLTVEFSVAAFRFGHSVVDSKIKVLEPGSNEPYETLSIPEVMFQPSRLRLRLFLDRILAGLSYQPMQSVDPFVTESLTNYLFHGGKPYGLDLASINIQRGRDYGIRSYNSYRRLIGLHPFTDFNQYPPSAARRLSSVYDSPEDVDLWIGGLLEEPVQGGILGPTFANIIADQFSKSKKGDRFFYEYGPKINPAAFTPNELAEVKKVTLARILCDNKDGYESDLQAPRAFLRADLFGNEPVSCDSTAIPRLDLEQFRRI